MKLINRPICGQCILLDAMENQIDRAFHVYSIMKTKCFISRWHRKKKKKKKKNTRKFIDVACGQLLPQPFSSSARNVCGYKIMTMYSCSNINWNICVAEYELFQRK